MGRANLERLDGSLALADGELRQRLQVACVERRRIMDTHVRDRSKKRQTFPIFCRKHLCIILDFCTHRPSAVGQWLPSVIGF
jgi:hypothetical protein